MTQTQINSLKSKLFALNQEQNAALEARILAGTLGEDDVVFQTQEFTNTWWLLRNAGFSGEELNQFLGNI